MSEYAYVYILASGFKHLYIGVTTTLEQRIWEHKNKTHPNSFTARYGIDQLVYFERHPTIGTAIVREKQLKGWVRRKKIALIVASNPTWQDLSLDWGQPIEPFREPTAPSPQPKRRHPERSAAKSKDPCILPAAPLHQPPAKTLSP
jgi:putative endonuclease